MIEVLETGVVVWSRGQRRDGPFGATPTGSPDMFSRMMLIILRTAAMRMSLLSSLRTSIYCFALRPMSLSKPKKKNSASS